ncbi:hypothetical protein FNF28_01216 [Cafeteria roenbergensis]|uniref:Peptidase S9 prolyl oligopeptidase catalytic domain-containing protein n=1 Tax=Cafeteria roenbergensis TaxID=33653 RepID=A0A5A8E0Q3_CAFRO|nr:hypothetical protein FNF28_01216 [Cafeteria roenbergensis]
MATSLTPEALVGIPRVGGPSVSASGARFAFVVTEIDSHSGKSRRSLFDGPSDGSEPPAPLFRARPGESLSSPVYSSDESTIFALSSHGSDSGLTQIWAVPRGGAAAYRVSNLPVSAMELCAVPWGDGDEHLVNALAFSAMVVAGPAHEQAIKERGALAATADADAADSRRHAKHIVAVDDLPVRHWDSWDTKRRRAHVFLLAVARPEAPPRASPATDAARHRWRCGRYADLMAGLQSDCPDQPWHGLSDAVAFAPGAETACLAYRPPAWQGAFAVCTGTALHQCRGIPILDVVASARDAAEAQAAAGSAPTPFRLSPEDAASAAPLPSAAAAAAAAGAAARAGDASPPLSPAAPLRSAAPPSPGSAPRGLRTVSSIGDIPLEREGLPGPDGAPCPTLPLRSAAPLVRDCLTGDVPAACWAPAYSPDGGTLAWLAHREPGYESDRARIVVTVTGPSGAVRVKEPSPAGATVSVRPPPPPGASPCPAAASAALVPQLSCAAHRWFITEDMDASFSSVAWCDEATILAGVTVRARARAAMLLVSTEYLGGGGSATPGIRKVVDRVTAAGAVIDHGAGSFSQPACAGATVAHGGHGARFRVLGVASSMSKPSEVASMQVTEEALAKASASSWSAALPSTSPLGVQGPEQQVSGLPVLVPRRPAALLSTLARSRLGSLQPALRPATFELFAAGAPLSGPGAHAPATEGAAAVAESSEAAAGSAAAAGAVRGVRQQWVLLPPGTDEATAEPGSVPVVVLSHGGPQGCWDDGFGLRWNPQVWASAGFACVLTNFTGSTSFGQELTDAIQGDWGGQPAADVVAGLDAAVRAHPCIDASRAAVCGASFGGFMVHWLQSHAPPGTFRCAVSHAGLFDMRSFYFATEELWFPERDFGGTYWERPDAYERFNPARFVQHWRTPMLVISGGRDFRVPQEQGLGAFTALRRQGVPARMLVLPEASHWVQDATQFVLWTREMLAWAGKYCENE